ncbi:hypothetical protein BDV29DRAFT_160267 [Aspergillus leporis]|uniref:Uncharacterized protein n=1 Tax=Aspergillus leporis TaxID=41062 RepID=A0A5N5WU42_9EURO|nr:hypothetical protein BDV29DRAFT_160267 [Aspergillus leporis]
MARFEEHFVRDSPLPSTQQLKFGSFESSSFKYKHDAYSTPLKTRDSGVISESFRNDTPVLDHSARFNDLDVSCSSSEVSMKIASPEIKKRHRISLGLASQVSLLLPQEGKGPRKPKANIMPLLRKSSRDDSLSTPLDLSRSSSEHGGLGITANFESGEHQSDPVMDPTSRKEFSGFHHRPTSGTSQLSTTSSSSMNKPGLQNIHTMPQATRSYTPPLSQSYQTSILESDASGKGDSAEGELLGRSGSDTLYASVRASSGQTPRLSLQTHDNSLTRLSGISQTNITGRSSFSYSRDNGSTLDTGSPLSRSSLDFVFRSRTRTSVDPISRAATVQAARQAFEEKEAAKTRKFQEQQMKAEEKQIRRKEKHHWRTSLRDEEPPSPVWEKEPQGKSNPPETLDPSSTTSQPGSNSGSWKSQPKNTWMLFLTWLRTRVFKLRRRVRNLG